MASARRPCARQRQFFLCSRLRSEAGLDYLVSGVAPRRLGNAHPNIAPYAAFPTAESWIILAVGNDEQFRRFCEIVDMPCDPRFATNADRLAHREVLTELVTAHTLQWQRDNLLAALEGVGVPAGPINTVADAFADPQVIARGMELTIPRVGGSPVPGVRTPIRFSRSRLAASSASPVLGKDEPGPSQSLHSP